MEEKVLVLQPTTRLYWQDDHCFETDALIVGESDLGLAFDRTCFYPGGGGQPADTGIVRFGDGDEIRVTSVNAGDDDIIWHTVAQRPTGGHVGEVVTLHLDRERRQALMRYHTVLHVLNTLALRDYGGWITGVQIGVDYSRIDFKFESFSPTLCAELETNVNRVLVENRRLKAYSVTEEEFRTRTDLLRTLEAKPPVRNGQVRVVEIEGFDAQACGGTHVHTTGEVGQFSIMRTENKGKINKRLYVKLAAPQP